MTTTTAGEDIDSSRRGDGGGGIMRDGWSRLSAAAAEGEEGGEAARGIGCAVEEPWRGEGDGGAGGLGHDGGWRWHGRTPCDGSKGATNPEVGVASTDGGVEGSGSGVVAWTGLRVEAASRDGGGGWRGRGGGVDRAVTGESERSAILCIAEE
uniref:DUF834 domain-containing protein n=1 Tax=Oryza punctata TaxID=4537 RepID=A0A0E0JXU5_ORYPU